MFRFTAIFVALPLPSLIACRTKNVPPKPFCPTVSLRAAAKQSKCLSLPDVDCCVVYPNSDYGLAFGNLRCLILAKSHCLSCQKRFTGTFLPHGVSLRGGLPTKQSKSLSLPDVDCFGFSTLAMTIILFGQTQTKQERTLHIK